MVIEQYEKELGQKKQEQKVVVNNKDTKKKKKPRGCLFGILKLLIILAVIIGVFFGYKYYKQQKNREEAASGIVVENLDKKLLALKEKESDIEGKTQYEKLEMGLSSRNYSDTDGDGLTDQEEIEVYNTDPLKASTSGDNIPDGYKVANGIDVNQKIKDKNILNNVFSIEDEFEVIELKNKVAENSGVNIREVNIKVNGIEPVKVFRVESYVGKVEIDFNEWIDSEAKYEGFIMTDAMYNNISSAKIKNGKIEADVKGAAYIGIIEKQNIRFNSDLDDSGNSSYVGGGKALIFRSPLMESIGMPYIFILEHTYFNFEKADRSEYFTKAISEEYGVPCVVQHTYIDSTGYTFMKAVYNMLCSGKLVENVVGQVSDDSELNHEAAMTSKAFFDMIWSLEEVDSGKWNFEFLDENTGENAGENKKEKPSTYMSTFNINVDAFPFDNFGTYYSGGGNCSGISLITSQVFNGNFFPRESTKVMEYDDGDEEHSYNLDDSEFDTLFDPGLKDFLTADHWNNQKDLIKNYNSITDEKDKRFLEFLSYKHSEANSVNDNGTLCFLDYQSWDRIEALKEYFASGDKIAQLSMCSQIAHTVNVYGMEQDSDNPDVWWLYIYDSNFPDNTFDGETVNNKMKITKVYKRKLTGVEEYFNYEYFPVNYYDGMSYYRWHFDGNWEFNRDGAGAALTAFAIATNAHGVGFIDSELNSIE